MQLSRWNRNPRWPTRIAATDGEGGGGGGGAGGGGEGGDAGGEGGEGGAPSNPWSGLDADAKAYVDGKGYKAVGDLVQSTRNLESLLGADKNTVLRIPKDDPATNPEGWGKLYERLGRPAEASGYEIQLPDGADTTFADAAREQFHALGLTKAQGEKLAKWHDEQAQAAAAAHQKAFADKVAQDLVELKREWGASYDARDRAAGNAAAEFGVTQEQFQAMAGAIGAAALLRIFNQIGEKLGEDTFQSGDRPGFAGELTPEKAQAALNDLALDPEWNKAWMDKQHPGHSAAVAKKERLMRAAHGG